MLNIKKMLAILAATTMLSGVANADTVSELKGVMSSIDAYMKRAIERAIRLYHTNQGANLPATESQLSATETKHGLLTLDITKNYNIVAVLKPIQVKATDEVNNLVNNAKIILAPIVSTNTNNKNVALSSFYCATNIGQEIIYGQADMTNIRSPLADATQVREMNNCMYVNGDTMTALMTAAYPS